MLTSFGKFLIYSAVVPAVFSFTAGIGFYLSSMFTNFYMDWSGEDRSAALALLPFVFLGTVSFGLFGGLYLLDGMGIIKIYPN